MKTPIYHNPEGVDPSEIPSGWRLLKKGEVPHLDQKCQVKTKSGWGEIIWNDQDNEFWLPRWSVIVQDSLVNENLEQVQKSVQDNEKGWIKFSDCMPTEKDLPIKCCNAGGNRVVGFNDLYCPCGYSHWIHDYTPPIPKIELTQEEKDQQFIDAQVTVQKSWDECDWDTVRRMMRNTIKYARNEQ